MKLKKTNAVLALLSSLTLIIHMGYNIFCYLTMYYNPTLKMLTAVPFMAVTCAHAVCGMCAVFLQGDGTRLDLYGKQNKRLILQRISAALIFPLLILHLNSYNLLSEKAQNKEWFLFALLMVLEVLFYATITIHVASSFSKAFITLGVLKDRKKQKIIDRVVYVLCSAGFLIAVISIVRGRIMMFVK